MPVRWGAAILHNVIIGQLWIVRGVVGLHYNATLCKIAWGRVGLRRVFWGVGGAALWLLPCAVGVVRRRQSHRRTCGGGKRQCGARRVGKKRDAKVRGQWEGRVDSIGMDEFSGIASGNYSTFNFSRYWLLKSIFSSTQRGKWSDIWKVRHVFM